MSSISFDRAADYYDETRGYPPGVDAAIAAAIAAAAGAGPATRFLEVGAGTGRIALPLIAAGGDYSGIDLAPLMLDRLRAKIAAFQAGHPEAQPRAALTLGDATALPYSDGEFDAVLTVHVLHLISGWEQALGEIDRVLKPGGCYLNCADSFTTEAAKRSVQHLWTTIVRELGFPAQDGHGVGAGLDRVAEALRARGWATEQLRTVTWDVAVSPAMEVAHIAQRLWSRTWNVPDDLFAAALPRLEDAARARYGAEYDRPQHATGQFVINRARKP